MFIYLSTNQVVAQGNRLNRTVPTAMVAGADGVMIPLLPNRCLVSSTFKLASPPAGVQFLFDTLVDAETLVPNGVINTLNTVLSLSIPLGVRTWRMVMRAMFRGEGAGRWTTLDVNTPRLRLGQDDLDVS